MLKRLLLMFSRILMDPCVTFRSLIHFEFIFVYGVNEWSNFILLHVEFQFFQCQLLKRLFSIGYSFLLFRSLVDHRVQSPFLESLYSCIDLNIYFGASTMLSWWLQLCNTAWNQALWCHKLWSSRSTFPWRFKVFSGSIHILGLFVLALWKMLTVFW